MQVFDLHYLVLLVQLSYYSLTRTAKHYFMYKKVLAQLSVSKKNSNGFTLIELLVVIAIIGILASVVMGQLNTARDKAADAAIKSNVTNIRGAASLWYDDYNSYASTPFSHAACVASTGNIFESTNIMNAINGAVTQSATTTAGGSRCVASAEAWAVAVQLKTTDGAGVANPEPDAWCADAEGASRAYTYGASESIASVINTTSETCK